MKKKNLRTVFDYFLLLIVSTITIVAILFFNGNRQSQRIVIMAFSSVYLLWGIIHHAKERTLNKEITLEYIIISIMGSVLVIGLI